MFYLSELLELSEDFNAGLEVELRNSWCCRLPRPMCCILKLCFLRCSFCFCRWTRGSCWRTAPMRRRSTCFARQLSWVCWGRDTSGWSPVWPWATPTALHPTASPSAWSEWLRSSGGRACGRGWGRASPLWRKAPRASRNCTVSSPRDTATAPNPPNTPTTTLCSGEAQVGVAAYRLINTRFPRDFTSTRHELRAFCSTWSEMQMNLR